MLNRLIFIVLVVVLVVGGYFLGREWLRGDDQTTVNVFNWSDYIASDTLARFANDTGIGVNYDVYDSNDTLDARLRAGSSGFDVVVPTSNYLQLQVEAGVYMPLNRDLLPNWEHMDPALMGIAARYDPGNVHSVIYMWGTTGIGYNVEAVAARLGEEFEATSWNMIFDPQIASQLADCGITWLDAPDEMLPAAMNYLGLDPQSAAAEDLSAAEELLMTVRPYVQYIHSSQNISDLANGEICVSVGWSGDMFQARDRAEEAGAAFEIDYVIPEEGALVWFDLMAIPADAPNPDAAHAFINFIMDPQVTADITNYVWYANANFSSWEFVDDEILTDPAVFPTDEVIARLWTGRAYGPAESQAMSQIWSRIRAGQ